MRLDKVNCINIDIDSDSNITLDEIGEESKEDKYAIQRAIRANERGTLGLGGPSTPVTAKANSIEIFDFYEKRGSLTPQNKGKISLNPQGAKMFAQTPLGGTLPNILEYFLYRYKTYLCKNPYIGYKEYT